MMSPIGTAYIFPVTTQTLIYYALTETSQGILSLQKLITNISTKQDTIYYVQYELFFKLIAASLWTPYLFLNPIDSRIKIYPALLKVKIIKYYISKKNWISISII